VTPAESTLNISTRSGAARIGLISDTHGLLRNEALLALRGSELIVHAGDVGEHEILKKLRALAPVVAVRGNVDTGSWSLGLPETAVAEASSASIYVLHDVNALDLDPADDGQEAPTIVNRNQDGVGKDPRVLRREDCHYVAIVLPSALLATCWQPVGKEAQRSH